MPKQILNPGEKSRFAETDSDVFYLRDVHRLVATEKRLQRLVLSGEIISCEKELKRILTQRLAMQSTNVRKSFRKLDSDYSGQLDKDEFRRFLECLNIHTTMSVFNKVFDSLDEDGGGTVGFNEFMRAFGSAIAGESMPIMLTGGAHAKEKFEQSVREAEERAGVKSFTAEEAITMLHDKLATMSSSCRKIFHYANSEFAADTDEESGLSKNEFRHLISKFNIRMVPKEFDRLYAKLDPDGSGCVSFPEFVAAFGESIAGGKTENMIRWGATAVPARHAAAHKFAELADHAEQYSSGPQVQRGGSLQEDHVAEQGGGVLVQRGAQVNDERSEFSKTQAGRDAAAAKAKAARAKTMEAFRAGSAGGGEGGDAVPGKIGAAVFPSSPIRSASSQPPSAPHPASLLKQSKAALVLQFRRERQAKQAEALRARTSPMGGTRLGAMTQYRRTGTTRGAKRMTATGGGGGGGFDGSSPATTAGADLFGGPAIPEDEAVSDAAEGLADELVRIPGGGGGGGPKLRPLNLAPLAPGVGGGGGLGGASPVLRPATPLPGSARPVSRGGSGFLGGRPASRGGRPASRGGDGSRSDQGFKGTELVRATPRTGGPEEAAQRLRDKLVETGRGMQKQLTLESPLSTGNFTVMAGGGGSRLGTAGGGGSRPASRSGRH